MTPQCKTDPLIFTIEPILVALDLDKKMRIKINVSDYTAEGMLLMECANGKWRPVAYLSKSINEIERLQNSQ